ncbi:hypothetical protein FACS1894167_03110 [Synergistales bacterium]|nr:hypothetical protein FACS1894167_03110 [Synergistales bacterium]
MENGEFIKEWFYVNDANKTEGPLPAGALEDLIKTGQITANTLVWNGEDYKDTGWVKLSETELETFFVKDLKSKDWHYVNGANEAKGPVSVSVIEDLIQTGQITKETLVWNSEDYKDWVKLSETELEELVPESEFEPAKIKEEETPLSESAPVEIKEPIEEVKEEEALVSEFVPTKIEVKEAEAVEVSPRKSVKYFGFLYCEPFAEFLTSVVRYTENKLREQLGFHCGKGGDIPLADAYKSCIDLILADSGETAPEQAEGAKDSGSALKLDLSAINKLRDESDELRELLKSPEEADEEEEEAEEEAKTETTAAAAEVDWQKTADLAACLDEGQNKILRELADNIDGCEPSLLAALSSNGMVDMLIDEINERALEVVGAIIISLENGRYRMEEDFREEFEKYS